MSNTQAVAMAVAVTATRPINTVPCAPTRPIPFTRPCAHRTLGSRRSTTQHAAPGSDDTEGVASSPFDGDARPDGDDTRPCRIRVLDPAPPGGVAGRPPPLPLPLPPPPPPPAPRCSCSALAPEEETSGEGGRVGRPPWGERGEGTVPSSVRRSYRSCAVRVACVRRGVARDVMWRAEGCLQGEIHVVGTAVCMAYHLPRMAYGSVQGMSLHPPSPCPAPPAL